MKSEPYKTRNKGWSEGHLCIHVLLQPPPSRGSDAITTITHCINVVISLLDMEIHFLIHSITSIRGKVEEPGVSVTFFIINAFYSILFYSILFYSILFYSILFYSMLCYAMPCHSILFYSMILFYSILFYSILFIMFMFFSNLALFYSIGSLLELVIKSE